MAYKILQITHKPPFPKVDGGCIEIAKMSSFYSSNSDFDLTIFTLSTDKHPFEKKYFEKKMTSISDLVTVHVDTKPTLFGAIKSLFLGESYNLNRFYNNEIKEKITKLVEGVEYDFILFESIYTGQYASFLKVKTNANLVLNTPNVEFKLWRKYANGAKIIKRWYLQSLAKKLEKKEIAIWKQMQGIICISEDIKTTIQENKIRVPTLVLPFKLSLDEYTGVKTNNNSLSFFHIGAMDWEPNKEGINWFVSQIWNTLSSSVLLHLAGKGMKKNDYNSSAIQVHGFVEDAKEFMNSHDVMVVPLLTGSGMRIKIIEAMALGKCVISTTKGAEGIDYTDKKNIFIANSVAEFKETINLLMQNPKLAETVGENGRKLIEIGYSSHNLSNELTPFLKSLK